MCSITDDVLYLGSLRAEGSYRLWWWISYQYSQVPARHSGSHLYPSYSGGRDWKDYRAPGSAQGPEFKLQYQKKKICSVLHQNLKQMFAYHRPRRRVPSLRQEQFLNSPMSFHHSWISGMLNESIWVTKARPFYSWFYKEAQENENGCWWPCSDLRSWITDVLIIQQQTHGVWLIT
jgi:hypothetical protein